MIRGALFYALRRWRIFRRDPRKASAAEIVAAGRGVKG